MDTLVSPLLLQAAAQAAGGQQHPAGTLYVVATPIGNLADLSLRAIHVLALADAVACEDTRVSGGLLQRLGLHKPLLSVHEHNEERAALGVIDRLVRGERVAYVSDAGTPAVSDPGARLVAAVRAAGHRVLPLPGASAVVTALSAAGDVQASGFRFVGFLSPKAQARAAALQALAGETASCVLFEAPHRIEALGAALAEVLPGRQVTVCRELTKQFESIHTVVAAQLPAWLAEDADRRRGEFVLVLHGAPAAETTLLAQSVPLDRLLETLLAALPLRQATDLAAQASGVSRKQLYQQALARRQQAGDGQDEAQDAGDEGGDGGGAGDGGCGSGGD
nr:16S rRNA (cytidine(1402)-2'-O)-methyltransferase [Sphaerotilus hippei]